MAQIFEEINRLLNILLSNNAVVFPEKDLLHISSSKIVTPIGNVFPLLTENKSILPDQSIEFKLLEQFLKQLNYDHAVIRLNHVGFCYKVDSQEDEKKRLIHLVKETKFHLYQEQSNDDGLWLFIGNTADWEEPLIELLPVEKTTDRWVDYWLPHIQIDIDTRLSSIEIVDRIRSAYSKKENPYQVVVDGVVYIVRKYLGIVDGVNFYLDLATNARNVEYQRRQLLKRLDGG